MSIEELRLNQSSFGISSSPITAGIQPLNQLQPLAQMNHTTFFTPRT